MVVVFEICPDTEEQVLRNQPVLRWRRRMRVGEESSGVVTIELENKSVVGEWGALTHRALTREVQVLGLIIESSQQESSVAARACVLSTKECSADIVRPR